MKNIWIAVLMLAALATGNAESKLPKVLIIGDSISIGYTKHLVKALEGKAEVVRIEGNGKDSVNGVAQVEQWMNEFTPCDVIHFNFGLWDVKGGGKGGCAVSLEKYEENLKKIVSTMKPRAKKLVFATTTPVPEVNKLKRLNEDVIRYNEAAVTIMKAEGVAVDDLYSVEKLQSYQEKDDVHFSEEGYKLLAQTVAESIMKELGSK